MSDAAREAVARAIHFVCADDEPSEFAMYLAMQEANAAIQAYEAHLTLSDLRRLAAKHGIVLVSEGPPGSLRAQAQGCTCPVLDNQGGLAGRWVIPHDCPLHGAAAKGDGDDG